MGDMTHPFEVTLREARRIQEDLRKQVVLRDLVPDINRVRYIGGGDVAFLTGSGDGNGTGEPVPPSALQEDAGKFRSNLLGATRALAGIVVIDRETLEVVEETHALVPLHMPYIPGFLSFREGPALLAAFGELSSRPEVMMYDGCGIAHPRGFGLASHMAVLTGIPSIGCAKSRLCGTCEVPGSTRGSWTDIMYQGSIVGSCVRTRTNVKPVFVSPGSGICLESARELVLGLAVKYRLPEATRRAHQLVSRTKAGLGQTL